MAFGLNRAELIGRIGADVTVNHLTSGVVMEDDPRGWVRVCLAPMQ